MLRSIIFTILCFYKIKNKIMIRFIILFFKVFKIKPLQMYAQRNIKYSENVSELQGCVINKYKLPTIVLE